MLWARQGPREHVGQRSGSMTSYTVQGLTLDCADGASKELHRRGKNSRRASKRTSAGSPTGEEINVELTYPLRGRRMVRRGGGRTRRGWCIIATSWDSSDARNPAWSQNGVAGREEAELRRPGGTTPSRSDACQWRLLLPWNIFKRRAVEQKKNCRGAGGVNLFLMAPIPRFHTAAHWFSALPAVASLPIVSAFSLRPNIAKTILRFHSWSLLLCFCGSGVKRVQVGVGSTLPDNIGGFVEHTGQCDGQQMTRKIFFFIIFLGIFLRPLEFSQWGWLLTGIPPEKPPLLPQVRLVPGGMFLCRGATSPSYLPVISVGRQDTTLSLAPEPQASCKGHNHRSTLRSLLWERDCLGCVGAFFTPVENRIEPNKTQLNAV